MVLFVEGNKEVDCNFDIKDIYSAKLKCNLDVIWLSKKNHCFKNLELESDNVYIPWTKKLY